MSRISLELPTLQNWSCHNCSGCCRKHAIFVTSAEAARIQQQNWETSGVYSPGTEFVIGKPPERGTGTARLAQLDDGACIFLDEQGLCRIHGKFGEAAKPLACRVYPYALHPKGEAISVSLRFSCPSVVENRGTPLTRNRKELQGIAALVVPRQYAASPPLLTDKTELTWPETLDIVQRLEAAFAPENAQIPTLLLLLRTLFWVKLLMQTNYDNIRHDRLTELLDLLVSAAPAEVPEIPTAVPPAKISQTQFRLLVGQYARHDTFSSMDRSWRGRWQQLQFGLRLSRGRGNLPPLHPLLGEVPFATVDSFTKPLPAEAEELLHRYYRVKLQGMHFCGPAYYQISLTEGFAALALTYPVILYLARWRAVTRGSGQLMLSDLQEALQIVDHQHGYAEILGTWGARQRVKTLLASENLERLLRHLHPQHT